MIYDVSLRLTTSVGANAASGRTIQRLAPMVLPGEQIILSLDVSASPPPEDMIWGVDFFGNPVIEANFRSAWSTFAVEMKARVERISRPLPFDLSPPLTNLAAEISGVHSLHAASPHHFTGPSARARHVPAIADYARSHLVPGISVYAAVMALNHAIHRDMTFDADATNVNTPAAEAFTKRRGVCQDFTHIMICGLRAIGIPAGYVSGFLRTVPPPGCPRMEGADAMHAWVRAWCGNEIGWIEVDPTNDLIVGTDHIVVGRGRDYSDVAPVRGVLRTAGYQTTEQSVDVVPVD